MTGIRRCGQAGTWLATVLGLTAALPAQATEQTTETTSAAYAAADAAAPVPRPEQENTLAAHPGSAFKDCKENCPVMVVVPPGVFMMGSPEEEADRLQQEGPQRAVVVSRAFAISPFEVTFRQWDACAAAGGCTPLPDAWGRQDMPAVNVSWNDAKQFVAWLSRVTQRAYRLPNEVEWEYAARAGAATAYFWGDTMSDGWANCHRCGQRDLMRSAPVGSFKPNAFGLFDTHGNVWEWCEDVWHDNYVGAPEDASAWTQGGDPKYRVVRGGSWSNDPDLVRAAVRMKRIVPVRFDTLGFRIVRTLPAPQK